MKKTKQAQPVTPPNEGSDVTGQKRTAPVEDVSPSVGAETLTEAVVDPKKVAEARERLATAISGEDEVKENVLLPVPVGDGNFSQPPPVVESPVVRTEDLPAETLVLGLHKCAAEGCNTVLSANSPELCPEHQLVADARALMAATADVAEPPPAVDAAPPVEPPPVVPPAPPTGKRYFKKLFAAMPLTVAGSRVPFQMLGNNIGVIATTDAALIAGLDELIAQRKSGVVAIDEATYESLKKNLPFVPSPKPPSSKLSIINPLLPKQKSLHRGLSPKPAGARAAAADLSVGVGVGSDGGGEVGGAGVLPASSHENKGNGPIDFKPNTAPKQFKMPVTKKATGNSLSGGTVEGKPIRLPN